VTEPTPKPLNKVEVWVSNRAVPIFAVIALLIVLGAGAVFFTYERSHDVESEVQRLAPRVVTVSRAICDKQSLDHPARAERCAARIRIGLVNCRHVQRCRAALLAALTYPSRPAGVPLESPATEETSRRDRATAEPSSPIAATSPGPSSDSSQPGGGDALQPPSNHGHQQEGPASPGPTEEATHEAPSAVSPSPAPAPPQGESPATSTETPETAPQPAPTAPKASVPAVSICVLEDTCAGVEIGLGGLLPKGSE
jgi:hypothetical protein